MFQNYSINQAFLWIRIQCDFVYSLYKARVSLDPKQMVTFWVKEKKRGKKEKEKEKRLFQKILFSWFLHCDSAKCHLQQMDMNTGNQRGCACTPSFGIWHQILSPGCQNSCCALSPPAVAKLCQECPSLEKNLPSGGFPGLETTPFALRTLEDPIPIFLSTFWEYRRYLISQVWHLSFH